VYIGDKSPTLTNSGIESCAIMLLIKSSNIIVEELYVGNTLYEGDNIFKGWHEHSHNLAQPSDNPDFDTLNLVQ
jgi:hypothetical protein